MTTFTALFKTAAAITLISGGAALANGNPPVTKYQCWDGSIKTDPAYCPPMTPAQHETWSKSRAVSNSTSNATGGQGGSAIATGGNAKQAQRQRQNQSSRNDNRSSASTGPISIDNSSRAAANAVYAGQATYTGNECAIGGGLGGSSVGQTFGGNFTVLDKACANVQQDNRTVDRVCTYLTLAECRAVMAYTYPQARAGMVAVGTVKERLPGQTVSVSRHEMGDGSFTRAMNAATCKGRDC